MTREYTAEDGLKILTYLGIKNITEGEIKTFEEKWSEFYQKKDIIDATWKLYAEALPFICGDGENGSFAVAQLRDSDFGDRLKTTGLDDRLKEGIDLDTILAEGNHHFIRRITIN